MFDYISVCIYFCIAGLESGVIFHQEAYFALYKINWYILSN